MLHAGRDGKSNGVGIVVCFVRRVRVRERECERDRERERVREREI